LVAALRERADEIIAAELERHHGRFTDLDETQQRAAEEVARAALAKVLHEPTVRLKDASGTGRGDRLAEAVRELFDL
jgi:glutamyl-tRNA reductase